jgi:hypothetical protein
MHLRQHFGEFARWGHDEALVGACPRDEVLDALVFEHAVRVLAVASNATAVHRVDALVQLVYEGRLNHLGLLRGRGRSHGRR